MNKSRKEVRKFMEERDWLKQPVSNVAKSIVIEAAELLEKFQWDNFDTEDINKNPELKTEIFHELADVFVYAIEMAILLDCDIDTIVHNKLILAGKKYPPQLVMGKNLKKYWEIKKKHRKNKD